MSNYKYKKDRSEFDKKVDELTRQWWLGNRTWWPKFVYHFTDIKNVVSILNVGFLYSRHDALHLKLIAEDSASSQIIENTQDMLTSYVRFYFRPLTPTAYMNEGFRPQPKLYQAAHCPVPVYLLFDMREVITLENTQFSDGSLARKEHNILRSADDFHGLPFQDIYHNRGWGNEDRIRQDEIKNRRHAEVIVPHRIALDHLTYIVCRSPAEYETLNNLLSTSVWNRWKNRVAVSKNRKLFNKEWLFVTDVTLTQTHAKFTFSFPDNPKFFGPFSIRVDIADNLSGVSRYFEKQYHNINAEFAGSQLKLNFAEFSSSNYTARLSIDETLAYLGKYEGDEIPF